MTSLVTAEPDNADKRRKRFKATEVSILDFYDEKVEKTAAIHDIKGLQLHLKEDVPKDGVKLRLYVVEDLSTEVIEEFGHKCASRLVPIPLLMVK